MKFYAPFTKLGGVVAQLNNPLRYGREIQLLIKNNLYVLNLSPRHAVRFELAMETPP